MRRRHHHLARPQVQQPGDAQIGLRVRLEVAEQVGAEDHVPRDAGELRHVQQQRDVAVRQRPDDEARLQPGQAGHRIRPGVQPVPAQVDMDQVLLRQARDAELARPAGRARRGAGYRASSRAVRPCGRGPWRAGRRRARHPPAPASRRCTPRLAPYAARSAIRLDRQSTTVPKVSKTMATGCLSGIGGSPATDQSGALGRGQAGTN